MATPSSAPSFLLLAAVPAALGYFWYGLPVLESAALALGSLGGTAVGGSFAIDAFFMDASQPNAPQYLLLAGPVAGGAIASQMMGLGFMPGAVAGALDSGLLYYYGAKTPSL